MHIVPSYRSAPLPLVSSALGEILWQLCKLMISSLKSSATCYIWRDSADKYGIVNLKLEAESSLVTPQQLLQLTTPSRIYICRLKELHSSKRSSYGFSCWAWRWSYERFVVRWRARICNEGFWAAVIRKKWRRGEDDLYKMRVNALRNKLHDKGLDVDGSREMMIARLEAQSSWVLDSTVRVMCIEIIRLNHLC